MKQYLIFISLLICTDIFAQDFFLKKNLADRYYDKFDYYKAIPMYEQILLSHPRDYDVYSKLADSYFRINDSRNAEKCYAFLVDSSVVKSEYLLKYARTLSRNGNYNEAKIWYRKYSEAEPEDKRGKLFWEAYQNITPFYKDSSSFKVYRMPFCSKESDFSPANYGDRIVFPSSRTDFSIIRSLYNWTNSSYLDLYISSPDSTIATPFSKGLNSRFHEGPVTFSSNLQTIIFTRSNFDHRHLRKSTEGINKLKLYQASWNETMNRWGKISPLPFNSNQYSAGHPSLSPDGGKIFFASDMPGGSGETDIYMSELIVDSANNKTWSRPVNLGEAINTRGSEMFPYIDNQGNLWYASNGLPGLGGLDIFMARKNNDFFEKPFNPGYPFNTRFDDFGYITMNEGIDGYLSSDRFNSFGDDDIFSISRSSSNIVIWVFDSKNKQSLSSVKINIFSNGLPDMEITSNASGIESFGANLLNSYKFKASLNHYQDFSAEYSKDLILRTDTIKIAMSKLIPKFQLNVKVISADNFKPFSNARVSLINTTGLLTEEGPTDQEGFINYELKPETDYMVKVEISTPGSKCSSNPIELSTRGIETDSVFNESFPVFCVGDIIKVENIYYDLGKFDIRPDAAKELDKLYEIMNTYPKMKIELRSHTDSRGSASSNMTLSDNRARAAAQYMYSKGVSPDRIIGKGYGDTMLINRCAKGVKCSEDEHKVNRRTEFKILSME